MHTFILCAVVAIASFGAGALYGHTLAILIADEFKKEMSDAKAEVAGAVAEIRKFRGEIFKSRVARGDEGD